MKDPEKLLEEFLTALAAMPKSAVYELRFPSIEKGKAALSRLSFVGRYPDGATKLPPNVKCGMFNYINTVMVILGGSLSAEQRDEIFTTLNKYIERIMLSPDLDQHSRKWYEFWK